MRLPCPFAGHGGTNAGSRALLGRQVAELVCYAVQHEVDAAVDGKLAVYGGDVITQGVLAQIQAVLW